MISINREKFTTDIVMRQSGNIMKCRNKAIGEYPIAQFYPKCFKNKFFEENRLRNSNLNCIVLRTA